MNPLRATRRVLAAALFALGLGAGSAQADITDPGFEDPASPWVFDGNASGTVSEPSITLPGFGTVGPLSGSLFAYMGTGAFDIFDTPAGISSILQTGFAPQAAPVTMAFRFISEIGLLQDGDGAPLNDDALFATWTDADGLTHDLFTPFGVADFGTAAGFQDSGWQSFLVPTGATAVSFFLFDYGTDVADFDGYASYVLLDMAAPVPEPSTYAMLLAGLGLLGVAARRRRATA